jgi:hypothetical protein
VAYNRTTSESSLALQMLAAKLDLIAGEAGGDEEPPHGAGQHRSTRSTFLACRGHTEPSPMLSQTEE